jgi:hypothetical protein
MAASGDSVAASRPSPGGGGLAWLTGEFIAPDALRPQWPTNQPATQAAEEAAAANMMRPPQACRQRGGLQVPPVWTWGGWTGEDGDDRPERDHRNARASAVPQHAAAARGRACAPPLIVRLRRVFSS